MKLTKRFIEYSYTLIRPLPSLINQSYPTIAVAYLYSATNWFNIWENIHNSVELDGPMCVSRLEVKSILQSIKFQYISNSSLENYEN